MSTYIDVDTALTRVRGNKKLYKKMLEMFMGGAEFGQFDEAIEGGDIARAADVAHGIKGMTGNLGLDRLYEISASITENLRHGNKDEAELAQYHEALEVTKSEVAKLIIELEGQL